MLLTTWPTFEIAAANNEDDRRHELQRRHRENDDDGEPCSRARRARSPRPRHRPRPPGLGIVMARRGRRDGGRRRRDPRPNSPRGASLRDNGARRRARSGVALDRRRAMDSLPALWDVVLVDCPPSLGYLGIAPLTACQEALVPVEAHVLAVTGLTSLLETMARVRRRLNPRLRLGGVVACRVNRTSLSRAIVQRLGEEFPESFIATTIRENIRLAEAPSFQIPITLYAPNSTGAEDYRALAREFMVGWPPPIDRRSVAIATGPVVRH